MAVNRVRRISAAAPHGQALESVGDEPQFKGFGAFGPETEDDFHDRMFELSPMEAMMYEMEFESNRLLA